MKKIISILLVLSLAIGCLFILGSCNGDNETPDDNTNTPGGEDNTPDDNNPDDDTNTPGGEDNDPDNNKPDDEPAGPTDEEILAEKLEAFNLAIEKTEPASAIVRTSIENDLLGQPMEGVWNLTYNEDGTIAVEYSYQYMIEDLNSASSDLPYETVEGTATIDADGNVTGTDLKFSKVTASALVKYNLDAAKLDDANVGLGVLSAKVAAADTASVLGVDLGADAYFTMTIVDNMLSSVTVNYEIDGVSATIITSFHN